MPRASAKPKRARRVPKLAAHELGCGIDVVEIARFADALKRHGQAFLDRVFTAHEQAYANAHVKAVAHLAARFAAKEAVVKAMAQVDPDRPLTLREIEIINDELGRPHVKLRSPQAARVKVSISLSHAETVAIASAIACR